MSIQLKPAKSVAAIPAVFGIFTERSKAELAVALLKANEYKGTEISVLYPHANDRRDLVEVPTTKALQGAEIGAGAGAVIGVLGWISGIGLLAVPGIGALVAAGPIAALLLTVGAGTGAGVLLGTLSGMGIPDKEAERFHGRLHKGDILLSVHTPDSERLIQAKEIMVQTGAEDVYSARGHA